eukprot:m.262539 g.262539  ORF g.262539 m.262539 type:complete len:665 (+) comp26799_c0_seq2:5106-7100(+)
MCRFPYLRTDDIAALYGVREDQQEKQIKDMHSLVRRFANSLPEMNQENEFLKGLQNLRRSLSALLTFAKSGALGVLRQWGFHAGHCCPDTSNWLIFNTQHTDFVVDRSSHLVLLTMPGRRRISTLWACDEDEEVDSSPWEGEDVDFEGDDDDDDELDGSNWDDDGDESKTKETTPPVGTQTNMKQQASALSKAKRHSDSSTNSTTPDISAAIVDRKLTVCLSPNAVMEEFQPKSHQHPKISHLIEQILRNHCPATRLYLFHASAATDQHNSSFPYRGYISPYTCSQNLLSATNGHKHIVVTVPPMGEAHGSGLVFPEFVTSFSLFYCSVLPVILGVQDRCEWIMTNPNMFVARDYSDLDNFKHNYQQHIREVLRKLESDLDQHRRGQSIRVTVVAFGQDAFDTVSSTLLSPDGPKLTCTKVVHARLCHAEKRVSDADVRLPGADDSWLTCLQWPIPKPWLAFDQEAWKRREVRLLSHILGESFISKSSTTAPSSSSTSAAVPRQADSDLESDESHVTPSHLDPPRFTGLKMAYQRCRQRHQGSRPGKIHSNYGVRFSSSSSLYSSSSSDPRPPSRRHHPNSSRERTRDQTNMYKNEYEDDAGDFRQDGLLPSDDELFQYDDFEIEVDGDWDPSAQRRRNEAKNRRRRRVARERSKSSHRKKAGV